MTSWLSHYQTFLAEYNPIFTEALEKVLSSEWHQPERFTKVFAITKTIMNKGKRVRPYLCWLASQKSVTDIAPILISLELLHSFALVHDDIMDASEQRRKATTIHAAGSVIETTDSAAQSFAILIGDLLLAESNNYFYQVNPNSVAKKIYQDLLHDVLWGQMLDLELSIQSKTSNELIETKTRLKTAHYTVSQPLQLGAAINNQPQNIIDYYAQVGTKIGLAFQAQDDLINITQPESVTGKPQMSDITNGQHTIISQTFFANAQPDQLAKFRTYFGQKNSLTKNDHQTVLTLLNKTNALKSVEKYITDNYNQSKQEITETEQDIPKSELTGFIDFLINRTT